jgi:hypothetical protein
MKSNNSNTPIEVREEIKNLLEAKQALQIKILEIFGTGSHGVMQEYQSRIQSINRIICDLELKLRRM